MKKSVTIMLDELKKAMLDAFGFSDEMGEPRINLGPCAVFAKFFFEAWNRRFSEKVHICFIMEKNSHECWHTLVRLHDGKLYDGGIGIHDESKWDHRRFIIEDMYIFDEGLLEKRSYGMDRGYPRHCPDFDPLLMNMIINDHLDRISKI